MGRVLPSPIKNRVGYGFKKKKTRSRYGFYQKTRDSTRLKTRYTKIYIYIYIFLYSNPNPSFLHFSAATQANTHSLSPHPSPQSQQLEDGEVTCAFLSDLVKPVFTFSNLNKNANQFKLVFANCFENQLKVSMDVRSVMYNLDGKSQRCDYLSVGKTILRRVYFLLSLGYFFLAGLWISILYNK